MRTGTPNSTRPVSNSRPTKTAIQMTNHCAGRGCHMVASIASRDGRMPAPSAPPRFSSAQRRSFAVWCASRESRPLEWRWLRRRSTTERLYEISDLKRFPNKAPDLRSAQRCRQHLLAICRIDDVCWKGLTKGSRFRSQGRSNRWLIAETEGEFSRLSSVLSQKNLLFEDRSFQ
jgi:hypothetical protein